MSEGPECQQHYMPETFSIGTLKPNYNIILHNANGEEVGVLDFNGPGLSFEGNAEESAIVFMAWVGKMFSKRLDEEYQRGLKEGKNQ
jgi:hypothetical protein